LLGVLKPGAPENLSAGDQPAVSLVTENN